MPHTGFPFVILEQVDSTNNYAMAKVHAGMAKHGDAFFSGNQTRGKGQRGRVWQTTEGENIALSVVLNASLLNIVHPFQLSAAIALASHDFFSKYAGEETKIKWPNDIYWRDRKAGGILIENKYIGKMWKWAIAGVGININQQSFDHKLNNAVSLTQVTGVQYEVEALARELHLCVMERVKSILTKPFELMLAEYHLHLYKLNEAVRLKKGSMTFETTVKGVSAQGQLLTLDAISRHFDFGEVTWVING